MPLGVLLLLIDVACAVHVIRTGRSRTWLWIIFLLPGFGGLVYFAAEIVPELFDASPLGRAAAAVAGRRTAEKDLRRLAEMAEEVPTPENKRLLADALAERGELDRALALYESALLPPHATDSALLMGLARCRFLRGEPEESLDALDRLIANDPGFVSHDGRLLRARALEAAGRTDEALAEYERIVPVFPGEEARVRAALLLQRLGRAGEAAALFDETVHAMKKRGPAYRRRNRQWLDVVRAAGRE